MSQFTRLWAKQGKEGKKINLPILGGFIFSLIGYILYTGFKGRANQNERM